MFFLSRYIQMPVLVNCNRIFFSSLFVLFMQPVSGWANELENSVTFPLEGTEGQFVEVQVENNEEIPLAVPLKSLGPVLDTKKVSEFIGLPMFENTRPWTPALIPFLDLQLDGKAIDSPVVKDLPLKDTLPKVSPLKEDSPAALPVMVGEAPLKVIKPAKMLSVDVHPKMPKIAILIDDLGYNRKGVESSLALPVEVALAILPETPFARKTALAAQKQKRITLLHTPMENQRELELGPGGLYEKMTEEELKEVLNKDLDGLPGIQGANNHMGSLLTTKKKQMEWVMDVLQARSFFFIDSLTSSKSVANQTAKEYGLKTVTRDVFLDNIRSEGAIDKQFTRLIKLARRHGSALAIGHPYPETTAYLKKRLSTLDQDGVQLIPLSDVLLAPANK
jgi:polysaccharide deacetylase 2 family uncharacterized protein YibQ